LSSASRRLTTSTLGAEAALRHFQRPGLGPRPSSLVKMLSCFSS
jgi:hypothetical protein